VNVILHCIGLLLTHQDIKLRTQVNVSTGFVSSLKQYICLQIIFQIEATYVCDTAPVDMEMA